MQGGGRGVGAYQPTLEQGTGFWGASQGMTERVDAAAHSGKGCLLVAGTQPSTAWSYAQTNLKQPLLPASRYRLSCWMQVEEITLGAPAPYLKIDLTDARGNSVAGNNLLMWPCLQAHARGDKIGACLKPVKA
jgi:hypothetical protein